MGRTWDACIQCGRACPDDLPRRCGRCRAAVESGEAPELDFSHHLAVLAALQEEYDLEAVARHRRIEAALA